MLADEPYLVGDAELVALRREARRLTRLYNATTEEEIERRTQFLGALFGQVGEHIEIEPPFFCDYGQNILVGDAFYANFDCVILDCNLVRIGSNVLFGPSVRIYAATHATDTAERLLDQELALPITIDENTSIGAGSVVTRDLPANVVAAGNPCRVIRPVAAPPMSPPYPRH